MRVHKAENRPHRNTHLLGVYAIALLLTATSAAASTLDGPSTLTVPTEQCEAHPPILVVEDVGPAGFVLGHGPDGTPIPRPGTGVRSGTGTANDPYVIEGWCFQASPEVTDLVLISTSAHVVIQDNTFHGAPVTVTHGGFNGAIWIDDVQNVVIRNNTVVHHQGGIRIEEAAAVTVADNLLLHTFGISIVLSEGVTIERNTILGSNTHAISISLTAGVLVQDNRIMGGVRSGIHMQDSDANTIANNLISGNRMVGVALEASRSNTLRNNTIADNDLHGVTLAFDSDDNAVEGNNITGHVAGIIAVESATARIEANNLWDNEEAGIAALGSQHDARGNWWGCADGPGATGCDAAYGDLLYTPWLGAPNPHAGARLSGA